MQDDHTYNVAADELRQFIEQYEQMEAEKKDVTERQKEIGDLVTCLARNVEKMQTTAGFHPKWRDVDPLDIERIQWPAHPAAVAAIKRESKRK